MKRVLFLLMQTACLTAMAQVPGEWTWMSGDSVPNSSGVFGTQGVPDVNNKPPGLYQSCGATDKNGNFWLFGGVNFQDDGDARPYNALWNFNHSTLEWTWMKGSDLAYGYGYYGTKGEPDPGNTPGSRYGATLWIDETDNLWLFGGLGTASLNADEQYGYLNDLWKYDIANHTWTWMHGSDDAKAGLTIPVYGKKGLADSSNTPNGRWQCNGWLDDQGNLWLFGGHNNATLQTGYYNDLWKYDPVLNQWTWMKGDSLPGQLGSYGTLGVADSTNNPSARTCQAHWVDEDGDLWMFGGYKLYNIDGSFIYGEGDDLWEYLMAEDQWICWNTSIPGNVLTFSGSLCLPDSANYPRGREQASMVAEIQSGRFWLFGGNVSAESLGDLWSYDPQPRMWVRINGESVYTAGFYGEKGISSNSNAPPSRFGGVSFQDTAGNFWLFGGIYDYDYDDQTDCFNDLWRIVPDSTCGVFTSANQTVNTDEQIILFPNPANSQLFIESASSSQTGFKLLNQLGEVMIQGVFSHQTVLQVSQLQAGLYLVVLINPEQKILSTEKIIIKR